MERDFIKFEGRKCSSSRILEPGLFDLQSEHQGCKDKCMTREDCGAIWVETGNELCQLMDRTCTLDNSVSSSSRTLYERLNFNTCVVRSGLTGSRGRFS